MKAGWRTMAEHAPPGAAMGDEGSAVIAVPAF